MKKFIISLSDEEFSALEEAYHWERIDEKNINEFATGIIKEHLGINSENPMDCLDEMLGSNNDQTTQDWFDSYDPD